MTNLNNTKTEEVLLKLHEEFAQEFSIIDQDGSLLFLEGEDNFIIYVNLSDGRVYEQDGSMWGWTGVEI